MSVFKVKLNQGPQGTLDINPATGLEFSTSVARKFGLPVSLLASHVGVNIKTEGRSARAIVDPYGNGVAGAGCQGWAY